MTERIILKVMKQVTNKKKFVLAILVTIVSTSALLLLSSCSFGVSREKGQANQKYQDKQATSVQITNQEKSIRKTINLQSRAFLENNGKAFCNQISRQSKINLFQEMQLEGSLQKSIIVKYNQDRKDAVEEYCPEVAEKFILKSKQQNPEIILLYKYMAKESLMNNAEVETAKGQNKIKGSLSLPGIRIKDNRIVSQSAKNRQSIPLILEEGRWLSENCSLSFTN